MGIFGIFFPIEVFPFNLDTCEFAVIPKLQSMQVFVTKQKKMHMAIHSGIVINAKPFKLEDKG